MNTKPSTARSNIQTASPEVIFDLRRQIDYIDGELLSLLARRNRLVQAILALKRRQGRAAYSPERERQIISRVCHLAVNRGIDSTAASRIFEVILRQFVRPDGDVKIAAVGDPGRDAAMEGNQDTT